MRTVFVNDILYFEYLYIYLPLDLNKHGFRTIFSNDSVFVKKRKNKTATTNIYQSTWNVKFSSISS